MNPRPECKKGAVVGDEWHKGFPTHESQRTQELYACMQHVERLVAMTGTLIEGRLDNTYPWIHLVEPRYYLNYMDFYTYH